MTRAGTNGDETRSQRSSDTGARPRPSDSMTQLFTDTYLKSLPPETAAYTRTEPGERGAGRLAVEVGARWQQASYSA